MACVAPLPQAQAEPRLKSWRLTAPEAAGKSQARLQLGILYCCHCHLTVQTQCLLVPETLKITAVNQKSSHTWSLWLEKKVGLGTLSLNLQWLGHLPTIIGIQMQA